MTEIRSAAELRAQLGTREGIQHSAWAWWTPGDFTRYRVTFVVAPYVEGGSFVSFLAFEVGRDVIVLRHDRFTPWTAEMFLARFGEKYAGWWAAIRPVLAAFDWTSVRADDLAYSSQDAVAIGMLLEAT